MLAKNVIVFWEVIKEMVQRLNKQSLAMDKIIINKSINCHSIIFSYSNNFGCRKIILYNITKP